MFYIPQGDLAPRNRGQKWFMNGREVPAPKDAVDYTRQAADTPEEPTDDFFNTLRAAHADHWIFQDAVAEKRLRDVLRDAQAAQATTPGENARLRQEGNNPTTGPKFVRRGDPDLLPDPDEWDQMRGKL